jgi:hypothetical protein
VAPGLHRVTAGLDGPPVWAPQKHSLHRASARSHRYLRSLWQTSYPSTEFPAGEGSVGLRPVAALAAVSRRASRGGAAVGISPALAVTLWNGTVSSRSPKLCPSGSSTHACARSGVVRASITPSRSWGLWRRRTLPRTKLSRRHGPGPTGQRRAICRTTWSWRRSVELSESAGPLPELGWLALCCRSGQPELVLAPVSGSGGQRDSVISNPNSRAKRSNRIVRTPISARDHQHPRMTRSPRAAGDRMPTHARRQDLRHDSHCAAVCLAARRRVLDTSPG